MHNEDLHPQRDTLETCVAHLIEHLDHTLVLVSHEKDHPLPQGHQITFQILPAVGVTDSQAFLIISKLSSNVSLKSDTLDPLLIVWIRLFTMLFL